MTMAINVRALEAGDAEAWRPLFIGYLEFYEAALEDAVLERTWQRLMSPDEGNPIGLIAERPQTQAAGPGVAVGIAHYIFHRSTWSPTWYCYLEDLYVAPAGRGNGAGRALIEAVYAASDARACTRTYWATQEFNATARALYDKVATKSPFVQYRR